MDQVAAAAGVLRGRRLEWRQLHGGLAHVTYAVTAEPGDRYVVKFLTQEMDDFGLMIPIEVLIANTVAAGESGVGARVVQALPEIPSVVLEFIDGRTLDTPDLARPDYIPRIGRAIAGLHRDAPPMRNTMVIWKFLGDYLGLIRQHSLRCPDGIGDWLPTVRRIQAALGVNALDLLWPRPATNPTYNQISGTDGGNFLRGIPMAWLIIGVPLLVGVVFYAFRYRRIHNHPLAIDAYDPEP